MMIGEKLLIVAFAMALVLAGCQSQTVIKSADSRTTSDDPRWYHEDPTLYPASTETRVIYFGFSTDEIPIAAYPALRAHAAFLSAHPVARLQVNGHTDERAASDYSIAIGERYGRSIQRFLVVNGAHANQIEVVSYGEMKPAHRGHDELSWARNRRGELVYLARDPGP